MNSSLYLSRLCGLALLALVFASTPAFSQVSVSIAIAPPPLIVEEQPPCPTDGLIWTPGYWAYADGGYYWVPGAWVQPPQIGFLWTPCYWGWSGGTYVYHPGYWGSTVGFYGGVNYGHGYWGHGYGGGRWNGNHFAYNTAVNNVSRDRVHNTYVDRTVIHNNSNRVSYNGGKGGINARPNAQERRSADQHHVQATSQQQAHFQQAAQSRNHEVKVNDTKKNKPVAAANPHPESKQALPSSRSTVAEKSQIQTKERDSQKQTPATHLMQPEKKTPTAAKQPATMPHPTQSASAGFKPERRTSPPTMTHAKAPSAPVNRAPAKPQPSPQVRVATPQVRPAPQGSSHPTGPDNGGQAKGGAGPQHHR